MQACGQDNTCTGQHKNTSVSWMLSNWQRPKFSTFDSALLRLSVFSVLDTTFKKNTKQNPTNGKESRTGLQEGVHQMQDL